MMTMLTSSNQSLKTIVDQIFADRRITRQLQQDLMTALLRQTNLSRQDQALAQQLFEAIRQGRLRVVD